MVYDHESMRSDLPSAEHVRPYPCSHVYFRIRTLGQSATEGIMVLVPVRFATMGLDRALFSWLRRVPNRLFSTAHGIRRPPTCGV